MATIQYTNLMPEYSGILAVYSRKPQDLDLKTPISATYTDPKTGYHLTFEGSGFQYKDDVIKSGKLDTLRFTNAEGDDFIIVTELNVKLKEVTTALSEENLGLVLKMLFGGTDTWTGSDRDDYIFADKGNDILIGGLGSDELSGSAGKDTMTGGEGSDFFQLWRGVGRDIVTDFDTEGGAGVHDYVVLWTEDYTIKGDENQTIIDIGKGDKLVLQGLDRADFAVDHIWFG